MTYSSGRHFLQIPGPTNVPERVLRAIDRATIDHRGPEFQKLGQEVLAGLKNVFKTTSPVIIFPASGTGAWEAALVNTLSAGDRVLMYETGHFATLWHSMAKRLALKPEFIASEWRRGADGLAALRRATPARQYRHARVDRDLQRGNRVFLRCGHDDADRVDLVDRGVGRLAAAGRRVEQHLPAHFALQTRRERGITGFCHAWLLSTAISHPSL